MSNKKKVIILTHSSRFHVDDVFAVSTLVLLMEKEGTDYEIVRSRDQEIISKADYVVDVGGIYDPRANRFDHHQKGGAGGRENGILYSSFGLVWKKFGEELCGNKEVADIVEKILVEPIDANDNGIDIVEQKYEDLYPYDMRAMIDTFRPTWKENVSFDDKFLEAISFVKIILQRLIIVSKDREDGRKLVIDAYNSSKDKRLIELDPKLPWEEILNKFPEPLFSIGYVETDDNWGIKTIRNNISSYSEVRKNLPLAWAGKRDEDLEKVTGVSGAVFCHNGLFIVVAKTKEAILKLAEIALNDKD